MPAEILSILQQVRTRVLTDVGEYQDAQYFPQGATLDLGAIAAEALVRADAWRQLVRNPVPAREPTSDELAEREAVLTQELAQVEQRQAEVPVVAADVTAPSVPQNIKGVQDGRNVQLTWDVATDAVGVAGYRVYRDGVQVAEIRPNNYLDFTPVRGQTYRYRVSAIDRARNESGRSVTATVTPL